MKNYIFLLALAGTAMSTSAMARDGSWYVGVEAGPSIVEDQSATVVGGSATVKSKVGADVDGIIGYDFGHFRLEGEVGYKQSGVKSYTSNVPTRYANSAGVFVAGATIPAGTYTNFGGGNSVLSFMLNGLLDFGPDDGLQGYVGGGVGVARVKATLSPNIYGDLINDSDTGFAWQGIAGIRAPLGKHVDVGLKYRYFNASKLSYTSAIGGAVTSDYRSHSLLGSLIYNFGGKAPPPPVVVAPTPAPVPVPVPEPAPAPVVVPCAPGPYIVFFDWDKSDITPTAAATLNDAIAAYGHCNGAHVMLAGHADRSGSVKYNLGLSSRRDAAVQNYLTSTGGISGAAISSQAFGEGQNRVATPDGVREPQNRRVEITYGPGSGN